MIIDHDKQGMQGTQQEDAVAKSHETTQARTPHHQQTLAQHACTSYVS
jgi:hypothetical protein